MGIPKTFPHRILTVLLVTTGCCASAARAQLQGLSIGWTSEEGTSGRCAMLSPRATSFAWERGNLLSTEEREMREPQTGRAPRIPYISRVNLAGAQVQLGVRCRTGLGDLMLLMGLGVAGRTYMSLREGLNFGPDGALGISLQPERWIRLSLLGQLSAPMGRMQFTPGVGMSGLQLRWTDGARVRDLVPSGSLLVDLLLHPTLRITQTFGYLLDSEYQEPAGGVPFMHLQMTFAP